MKSKKGIRKMEKSTKKSSGSKISDVKFKKFYEVLSKKREDILSAVKQKEEDLAYKEIGDEADVASQTFEREMMFELSNGDRMVLDDIEAALRKIEKDDYGNCESCHKKITNIRLHAMPWARYCISCQSRTEVRA